MNLEGKIRAAAAAWASLVNNNKLENTRTLGDTRRKIKYKFKAVNILRCKIVKSEKCS